MVVINGKRCAACPFLGFVNGISYCRILAGECASRFIVDFYCRRGISLYENKQLKLSEVLKNEL